MPEWKRVYIVVKTYPTISRKYSELVCTAGVLEDGSWIRLYPIPFRKLDIEQRYPKYTWVNVEVERNFSDFRPETYHPVNLDSIKVEPKPKKVDWDERRSIIFRNKKVYTNLQELIEKAKSDKTSLAVFKPTKILDLVIQPTDRDWNPEKLEILRGLSKQTNLFQTPEEIEEEFKVVRKVPYKFSYRFLDDTGRDSMLMVEDWEIGMLFFNCLKQTGGDERAALDLVKSMYFSKFLDKDLYFFLGTILQFHNIAPDPFIIIGVFYPPKPSPNQQISFLDS